jgi:thiamine-monophosphate kinase
MDTLPGNHRPSSSVRPGEFDLIQRFFASATRARGDVALGIGDDAALVRVPEGHELVVAVDTLVAGVHFPDSTDPADVGYKAMAVNLSDLASMGAEPRWATLALTLPDVSVDWLAAFSRGLAEAAASGAVQLVGGDTTRGALTISVQLLGVVPEGQALRRGGAQAGDGIYVTGTLGDGGLGLQVLQRGLELPPRDRDFALDRLNRPRPRLAEGRALVGLASACIDISDGLLADLGHILESSGLGAELDVESLPLSDTLRGVLDRVGGWSLPLTAGDDYELCFTLPRRNEAAMRARFAAAGLRATRVGTAVAGEGVSCRLADGSVLALKHTGFRHF